MLGKDETFVDFKIRALKLVQEDKSLLKKMMPAVQTWVQKELHASDDTSTISTSVGSQGSEMGSDSDEAPPAKRFKVDGVKGDGEKLLADCNGEGEFGRVGAAWGLLAG